MTVLNKASVAKYIESTCGDMSIDKVRTKLSLLFGYYAGHNMSTVGSAETGDSYTALFSSQWKPFEDIMVALNEIRPIDFELAKSTAAAILIARARLNKGGLTNLFITTNGLQILDFKNTTAKLLGQPVSVQDVTLFFTVVDKFSPSN